MVKLFKISITFSLVFLILGAFAQQDTSTLENVDVYTNYKPDVAESVKVDLEPTLEEPKMLPPKYDYEFPNVAYKPKAVYTPIDPVFLKPEKPEDLFDNYIELGGGNFTTSYIDASIHNTQDKYYTYGLRVKHHAASSSNYPQQGLFSQNRITAFGAREKGTDLRGEIDYQRNVVHYYGYLIDTPSLELNDINQIYNDINANAEWTFDQRNYDGLFDVCFNIFDNLGESEATFKVQSNNKFKAGSGKFSLDVGGTYTQLSEKADYNRLFIDVLPHFEFKYQKYRFDLGVLGNFFLDSMTGNSAMKPYFAPYLKAETYLVPKKLRAYAGITGGLHKNMLRQLAYDNLFIGNNLTYTNPQTVFNVYAGMNGSFKRFVEYGIKMSQEAIRDQYLFINDTNELRNFTTVSDDISRFTFSGEVKFDVNRNLDIGFRGNFYAYSTTAEASAWHMPTYDAALFTTIRLADKVYLDGGYFGTSNRKARDLAGNEFTLPAINDLNVGLEYRYKKNISAFVKANNILNQKYVLWNYYNAQGINVLAGVTFSL